MGDRVQNRTALITGAASGIGRGCAERLADEGAHVVLTDIQDEMGKDAVAAIQAAGGSAEYLHHDVTSEDEWIGVIETIANRHGALHILDAARLSDGANTIDLEQMAARGVPNGVLGQPRDIAYGVLFLASDDATHITGTELIIDGGSCA